MMKPVGHTYENRLKMWCRRNLWACVLASSIIAVFSLISSCGSLENHEADRREQLLAIYPPGKTTRTDVQQRWGNPRWDFSETRPAAGWATNRFVGARALTSEQRTGQPVHRIEGHLAPDGISGGLCRCWFYYNEDDRLVDVDWQWHTD
jgi:hypothetical protein